MRASERARERAADLLRRRCDEGYLSFDTFERSTRGRVSREARRAARRARRRTCRAVGIAGRFKQWRVRPSCPAAPGSHGRGSPAARAGRSSRGGARPEPVLRRRGLRHPTVSRSHAALRRTADGWYVRDLGSSNGTWVDGRPVERADPSFRATPWCSGPASAAEPTSRPRRSTPLGRAGRGAANPRISPAGDESPGVVASNLS